MEEARTKHLVLNRKPGEEITIIHGSDRLRMHLEKDGGRLKVHFLAPDSFAIIRSELLQDCS